MCSFEQCDVAKHHILLLGLIVMLQEDDLLFGLDGEGFYSPDSPPCSKFGPGCFWIRSRWLEVLLGLCWNVKYDFNSWRNFNADSGFILSVCCAD